METNQTLNDIEDVLVAAKVVIAEMQAKLERAAELYVEVATQKEQETYQMWSANSRNPECGWLNQAKRNLQSAQDDAEDIFWDEINSVVEDPGNTDEPFETAYQPACSGSVIVPSKIVPIA